MERLLRRRSSAATFFLLLVLGLSALLAVALPPRLSEERSRAAFALLVDWGDVLSIARARGEDVLRVLEELKGAGFSGLVVQEVGIKDLYDYGISLGSASSFLRGPLPPGVSPEDPALLVPLPLAESASRWISLRWSFRAFDLPSGRLFVVPGLPPKALQWVGFFYDEAAFRLARRAGLRLVLRPQPMPGSGEGRISRYLEAILSASPDAVLPAGDVFLGFPEGLSGFVSSLKGAGVPLAVAEFSRQRGLPEATSMAYPFLLPLHSIPEDEINLFRVDYRSGIQRYVRAARERGQNLLLIRPFWYRSGDPLEELKAAGREVSLSLSGFPPYPMRNGWPDLLADRRVSRLAHLGMGLFLSSAVGLLSLYAFPGALWLAWTAFALSFVPFGLLPDGFGLLYRLSGLGVAVALSTLASVLSMAPGRGPYLRSILLGLGLAVAGGLAIASYYGTPRYALKVDLFFGVKLSLVLPLLLVAFLSFLDGFYPERPRDLMLRPIYWFEVALGVAFLGALAFMLLRSGNFGVFAVAAAEERLRLLLEIAMGVRPRTKEIAVGYPALVLCLWSAGSGFLGRYRVLLRLAGSVAFVSVVNSFCHLHTPLVVTLLRVALGAAFGCAVGLILVLLFSLASRLLLWADRRGLV